MKVVSIIVVDVNVIGVIPVIRPVLGIWIHHQERIPAVFKSRISQVHHGQNADAKGVPAAEIEAEAILRNVVTAVAPALRPGAMVAGPVLRAILSEGRVLLPAAAPLPSPLLLPRMRLLL